jgi:ornithine cyclodeaminase/alanine dehydrogenase-like protein (mu-crystallin family)
MLHPGLHVTAVGSDAEHKQELPPRCSTRADLVVCDHRGQSLRLGELRSADAAGVDLDAVIELGEVVAGSRPGRRSPADITVCDLTGTGAQDTAIATLATRRCEQTGRGLLVET